MLVLLLATGLLLAIAVNAQDDVLFRAVTNDTLNLRACGSTDCARVGQVAGGTELPVLAVEGDWYQVLVDGEPAWLAGWLTTRLPATDPAPTRVKLLAMGETWEEPVTGCKLLVGKVADEAGDLALLLAGDGRREVRVDVFLPGAASALPLADSSESLADVMGNPVTVRTWPASLRWPAGRYRFALGLGELSSEFEWEMPGPGEYSLLVDCERPAAASATGEAPVRMLVAEQIYRDQETGCNLFLSALQGQAGLDVLLLGERRREVRVYLFLPGEETALQPEREKEEDQPDEGEAHVALFYSRDSNWRTGLYRIELKLGEVSSVFGWEMESPGKYALLVDCERPASAPVTGDAPPQLLLTGEIYRDRETGCNLVATAGEEQAGFEVVYIGEQRREVRVELFLPDERTALPPEPDRKSGQFDDGVAYIAQTYASDLNWRPGLYRIELKLGESGSAFVWNMESLGKYFLFVDCDESPTGESASDQAPVMLELEESHHDPITGCIVVLFPESVDDDLNLLLQGERQEDLAVRVFGPDESRPRTSDGRLNRTFKDSDAPYLLQFYAAGQGWPAGLYRLELELEGQVSEFVWHMEAPRDQSLLILCDEDPPGQEGAGVTVGPTPTPFRMPDAEELGQGAPLFQAVTNNTLNLRACASADCERVGQVAGGTNLPVYAVEGDWYQALVNGEPVWLAGWLTTRVPDMVLEDTSMILDERTGCTVLLGARQLFDVLHIMVGGDRHEDVHFDFFAPGASEPLTYSDRSTIGLEESDGTMIEHVYQGVLVSAGEPYRLLIELDGRSNLVEWVPAQSGGTAIFIICNDPETLDSETGPGPISSAATQISQAAAPEGAGDRVTPAAPTRLQTNDFHTDSLTGCDIEVTDTTLDGDLNIWITSGRPEDVDVRIYRPDGTLVPFTSRFKYENEETGNPFDWQYYETDDSWQDGTWLLEIRLDAKVSRFAWQLENAGDQVINIFCDLQDYLLTLTASPADSRQDDEAASSGRAAAAVTADPTPATVLEIGDTLRDAQNGCLVRLAPDSPGQDLDVVLSGERRAEVEVRVFRPGAGQALPFTGRIERYLVEGEPPIIRQNYSADLDWPWGLYRLEVEVDGRVSAYAWRMELPTDQFFLIICEETRAIPATPATPAPDAASPRLLETDVAWRDDHTGCEILVSDRKLDGDLNIWITSPRPEDVVVRVYRPGESSQVPFSGRFRDDIEEADLPLDWQYYKTDDSWRDGTWQLEISLDGKSSRFDWQLENAGDQIITILCDAPDLKLALTTPSPDSQEADRDEARVSAEPTPPRVLETDVIYRDDHTGCDIIIDPDALDGDLNLALAGDRYEDIEARVYRPGSDTPLRYTDRVDDVFAESDEAFIWQYYTVTSPWIDGLYRLEIELDGRSTQGLWELERGGDQLIYVFCNTDENQLPVATLTPTPTATPSPTVTATPSPTRTPVPTRARVLGRGENLRDFITGCDLFLDHEGLDGHFHLVFTDSRQEEVEAWVYRPGDSQPYEYSSRRNETFDDSGEPFVWQIYRNFGSWPDGMYRLQIELDGRVSEVFWDLKRGGDQVIYISCDRSVPPATVTPTPTLTWTPSPTPTPTLTATPTPPEADADVRTGALHKDEATGCTLLVLEFPPEQVDWKDLWITRGGSERDFVEVEVWLPDAERPLPIDEMYEDVIETGESLVVQSYSPRTDWRNGLYRFDLGLDGASSSLTWRMSGPGYYAVSVTCDRARGPAPSV